MEKTNTNVVIKNLIKGAPTAAGVEQPSDNHCHTFQPRKPITFQRSLESRFSNTLKRFAVPLQKSETDHESIIVHGRGPRLG
jgi:hypothetical protein